MTEPYRKPLPEPSIDSQPYWDGLKDARLLLQSCAQCGKVRHYPRPVCDSCYSMDVEWIESSARGTVHSWTETHHPFHFGFKADTPYILVTVDLPEGVRLQSRLTDASIDDVYIGLAVEVIYVDVTEEVTLPMFRVAR